MKWKIHSLVVGLFYRYSYEIEWKILREKLTKKDNICNSGAGKWLLLEIVIALINPYPGLPSMLLVLNYILMHLKIFIDKRYDFG